ncbi:uncharacterized protein LOC125501742 [Athalia rosae]|uniref:uncharacterized protein LOC125501742 n=1 Tax=Athalia rosae TaxID=37344 RepID=UPI002033E184|nr:uncharacterized protein LOC125501742 [Athalia rosae]
MSQPEVSIGCQGIPNYSRMGTVGKKNLPHRETVQKVKGRTFHLPLPLDETLNKVCRQMDPINLDHEFYMLVRGIPTKSKLVWEQPVDMNKVWEALVWLKTNNPQYSKIELPASADLLLAHMKDVEFQIQDNRDTEIVSDHEDDPLVERNKNHDEIEVNDCTALLAQASASDAVYEQFTVYTKVYEKRENETATNLYQMLRIHDEPLDNREKMIDLQCFPHLYPYGCNGQHEDRPERLTHFEFIELRLMSKHSQFRTDQQYLFYLLNDANNNRQLNSGIYYKLDIINPRERFTAASYLSKLSKKELEGNLNATFARLRNAEQYRSQPRNGVSCITYNYGAAAWFLTLSPSKWLWSDMTEYLRKVGGSCTAKMSPSHLVASDPVSASRFIDNQFKAMLDFICSPDNPIGEVTHFFWRRQYQGRGMQHFHLMNWIKDAPILETSSNQEVADFILKYATCRIPSKDVLPNFYRRVNTHQRHTHNSYCLRSKANKHGKSGKGILKILNLGIFVGRNEANINNYNPAILSTWKGNMDIQFIREESTLPHPYVTKYITQPEKSNSDTTFEDMNSTKSLCSRLCNFASRMLYHRECGALKAADTLLEIALYSTDPETTIRWIDVKVIRNRKVKSRNKIEALEADSTEIFCDSLVDTHHPARPEELESTNLYDFVQWYDTTKYEPKAQEIEYYPTGKSLFLKKRKYLCLVNHYKNNVNIQPERYFYALLLLFQPWRDVDELRNGCVPIEAEGAMNEFKDAAKMIETVDVSKMMSKLNMDQKRVFDQVIEVVSSNQTLHLYVSGEGGTGKSFLIKTIRFWIKQHANKDAAITAPTGIAAFNVDGLTLSDAVLKTIRDQLRNVALRVSMISNVTFMYIHLRLVEIFNTADCEDGWFRNKHILLCGDLLQFPPVHEGPSFTKLSNTDVEKLIGAMASVDLWCNLFTCDELTINMRQKNDQTYREIFSRIRLGIVTDSDTKMLSSRKITFKAIEFKDRIRELCYYINNLPIDTVCLLPTCRMCDVLNEAMLSEIQTDEVQLLAHDTVDNSPYFKKKVQKILNTDDEDSFRTAGLARMIIVKIDSKIMIRRNIDVTLGLVNGTIGTITAIS